MMIEDSFLDGLNQHGFVFQHRVLHEALAPPPPGIRKAPWTRLDVETPVPDARIDFILSGPYFPGGVRLLIAECKRVNPAFGTWCFTRSPHPRPDGWSNWTVVEFLKRERATEGECRFTTGVAFDHVVKGYDVGFEVKSDDRGDAHPVSPDRDAIERACTQVLRGMNGLIAAFGGDATYRRFAELQDRIWFIPVVFTTAKLVTSETDFTQADLASGVLSGPLETKEADWLYFQYPQSPQLEHSLPGEAPEKGSFEELVVRSYVRSVAIVGPKGIRRFLNAAAGCW